MKRKSKAKSDVEMPFPPSCLGCGEGHAIFTKRDGQCVVQCRTCGALSDCCPKCGRTRVGFSETSEEEMFECRLCDPWHLFEPPEHMKGRGPSKKEKQWKRRELKAESKPALSRKKMESWENQLYWLIDDIIVKAAAAGGQCFPKRYHDWEDYHPGGSLEWWIESEIETNDSLSFDVKRIQQDLTKYLRSTEPDKTLELIADHQHCWDNVLRGHDSIKRKSVRYLSSALVEMFPQERVFEIHTEDCRKFTFRRSLYKVGTGQGDTIKLLIEEAERGSPNVSEEEIKKLMKPDPFPSSSALRSYFRSPLLWNTLLISRKPETRCLVFFPEK